MSFTDRQFLDSTGTSYLWKKIKTELNKKVDSVSAGTNGGITVSGTTSPVISIKLDPAADNALSLSANGLYYQSPAAADTYAITKDTLSNDSEYAAVYHLKKYTNGTGAGVDAGVAINIPKDMVVQSGSVITKSTLGAWGNAGTYIELVLANATNDKLYIPVDGLIEYVTSGSTNDSMVQITVSNDHKVTAAIKAGSITTTELASSIVTSLGKADSAVQSITTGDAASGNGTIKVDGNAVSVYGLGTAAYTDSTAYDASGQALAVYGALKRLSSQDIDDAIQAADSITIPFGRDIPSA